MSPSNRRPRGAFVCALLLLALLAGAADHAAAGTTVWHVASGLLPSQIPCPWSLSSGPPLPAISSGHLVIATSSGANNSYYRQAGAQLSMPADSLVVEFRCRYVSGGTSSGARAPISIVIEAQPFRGTGFFIGSGEVFFTIANVTRGGTATLPTADAMHLYRLVIIGTALRIYRDGALILTGSTFIDSAVFTGTVRIEWGEGSSLAFGTHHWESFTHNASPGTNCGVTADRPSTWGAVKSLYR